MSSTGAIGSINLPAVGGQVGEPVGEVANAEDEAAAFLKQLTYMTLTMASNSVAETYDLLSDLEDEDE